MRKPLSFLMLSDQPFHKYINHFYPMIIRAFFNHLNNFLLIIHNNPPCHNYHLHYSICPAVGNITEHSFVFAIISLMFALGNCQIYTDMLMIAQKLFVTSKIQSFLFSGRANKNGSMVCFISWALFLCRVEDLYAFWTEYTPNSSWI